MSMQPISSSQGADSNSFTEALAMHAAEIALDEKKTKAAILKQFEKDVGNAIKKMQSDMQQASDDLKKSTNSDS